MSKHVDEKKRVFMKGTALAVLGGATVAAFSPNIPHLFTRNGKPVEPDLVEKSQRVKLVRSICLQCHGGCGFQAKIKDFDSDPELIKLDGNPFHPNAKGEPIPFNTPVLENGNTGKLVDGQIVPDTQLGHLCAKGQAGIQTLYDPQRLTQPLKRKGPRGSGEWEPITWEQAYDEIILGSQLDGPDGKKYTFTGMKDLITDDLIDPNKPWLGSKRNLIVFLVGRSEHGRKELSDRIFGNVFGTVNYRIDHTTICEQSHHIAYKNVVGKDKMHPDFDNSEFFITFGGSYLDAQFPFNGLADKVARFKLRGGKYAVVDPRFSNTAKHADWWFPILPGTDAAFALAIANYIFANDLYDVTFLSAPNMNAVAANGETSGTNATWVVNTDTHQFVTMADLGRGDGSNDANPVVWNGTDFEDATTATSGELFPGALSLPGGGTGKTALELYREQAESKTIDQWLEICGVSDLKDQFIEMVQEFARAGKRSGADMYRGAVQHTNGYYNGVSIILLNLLMGNIDWKGGMAKGGGHWHEMGTSGTTYNGMKTLGTTISPSGWKLTREGVEWGPGNPEYDAALAANPGTTPKPPRPFYPLTSMVWQEVWGAIESEYPYRPLVVWNHMGNPNYSIPGSKKVQEVIEMPAKDGEGYQLPLFISVDVVMGEASAFADYILPDVTFYERFGTPHVASSILTKTSGVRQPIFGEFDPETGEYTYRPAPGYENCKMAEDIYIELARRMKEVHGVPLDGVGKDAFGPGEDLMDAWDWYRRAFQNLVEDYELNTGPIPGDTINEKIKYMLDRGGLFEDYTSYEASGDFQPHTLGKICNIWIEKVATKTHPFTGEKFWGTAIYQPIMDLAGNEVITEDEPEYPFRMITYKLPIHTQSRTANNPVLVELLPKNALEINSKDAETLGLKTGDWVNVSSKTSPEGMDVQVYVTNLVRPGVVMFAHSFGHSHYGAAGWKEGEKEIKGDPRKGTGFNLNGIMRLDTTYEEGQICLTDPIGGSAVFYDTMVKITKK